MEFTKQALEAVLKSRLYDLAIYYELDVSKRNTKGEIIEKLLERFNKIQEEDRKVQEAELPPMSVRVRRIYESNKEK